MVLEIFTFLFVITAASAQMAQAPMRLRNVFDDDLYKRVLDPELCHEQLQFLTTSINSLPFYDAGIRFPRGILKFNFQDWGNYHQCLEINQQTENVGVIEGKYCSINVPLQLDIGLPTWLDIKDVKLDEETLKNVNSFEKFKRQLRPINGRSLPDSELGEIGLAMDLAICIPKVCTSRQVIEFVTLTGGIFNATETFCRLPDDKPFAPVDIVAMALCGLFLFLIIISTSYDVYHNVIKQRNRKDKTNTLCCSFSLHTNTRRLLTFNYGRDALHCIDGIRSIAMLWVVVGHVFSNVFDHIGNPLSVLHWMTSIDSVWIMSAPITVDTFFLLSGLLLVYTTAEKLGTRKFLKNIHMFYILRYLRLFPILAIAILFQASLVHHMADGPSWHVMAQQVQNCRDGWWWPLIYVQNYVNLEFGCLSVVWYLCVDMQLFWISPLVLVWVLSGRRVLAWFALGIALFLALLSSSLYSFIYNFPSTFVGIVDLIQMEQYFKLYYMNTLTRAGPFFVGMLFGYLLHVWRGKRIRISMMLVILAWVLTLAMFGFIIFITYPITQADYENQAFDGFYNAYIRSLWALALGWTIFACAHGYGGPINWFLSLNMWKLPARLSYAMYLIHMPLIFLSYGSMVNQLHFSAAGLVYRFFSDLALTWIAAFVLTLAVDSPFSTLIKLLTSGGPKRPTEKKELTNGNAIPEKSSTSNAEKMS